MFWGVVTIVFGILPLVGAGIIWLPAAISLFLSGHPGRAIGLIILGVVVVANVENVIRPYVFKRYSEVHPMITLVGAVLGVSYFGLIGLLIGPLALSYFFEVIRMYREEYLGSVTGAPAPRRATVFWAFAAIYVVWGSTYLAIRVVVERDSPAARRGIRFLSRRHHPLRLGQVARACPRRPAGSGVPPCSSVRSSSCFGNGGVLLGRDPDSLGARPRCWPRPRRSSPRSSRASEADGAGRRSGSWSASPPGSAGWRSWWRPARSSAGATPTCRGRRHHPCGARLGGRLGASPMPSRCIPSPLLATGMKMLRGRRPVW